MRHLTGVVAGSRREILLLVICAAAASCAQRANERTTTGTAQPAVMTNAPTTQPGAARPVEATSREAEALSPLEQAAQWGDADEVRRLLSLGSDANARGSDGQTPLLIAMQGAFRDALKRSMPLPDQRDDWTGAKARAREHQTRGQPDPQRGPMQFAEVTQLLLAHGADPSGANNRGVAPLHVAASVGNAGLVSLLVAAKADVNAVASPGWQPVPQTPLIAAAASGDVETVRILLDAGADLAKVPEQSRRYFVMAAMSDIGVFRLLVDRGLKLPPNALEIATRNNHPEIAAEIIQRGGGGGGGDRDAALYATIKRSQDPLNPHEQEQLLQSVKSLLDAGASPSAPDGTGEALVIAIERGRTQVAQLLRERGAKIDWARIKDQDHQPFMIAYSAAFERRIDRLREFEALGMPLDSLGACILGRADRLRQVLAAGKEPVAGEAGSTALYFAAHYGHADCVKLMLDAGTDVNARLPSWDTPNIGPRPLQGAAVNGHADVVRLLLDRGAKPELIELDEDEQAKLTPEIRRMLSLDERR